MPLHLMPLAWLAIRAAVPVLGAAVALAIFALAGAGRAGQRDVRPGDRRLAGDGVCDLEQGPVRDLCARSALAVIGSEEIALGLDEELRTAGIRAYKVVGWLVRSDTVVRAARGRAPAPRLPR